MACGDRNDVRGYCGKINMIKQRSTLCAFVVRTFVLCRFLIASYLRHMFLRFVCRLCIREVHQPQRVPRRYQPSARQSDYARKYTHSSRVTSRAVALTERELFVRTCSVDVFRFTTVRRVNREASSGCNVPFVMCALCSMTS